MGFPFELITMLGSTLLSGVMSMISQNLKAKQAQQKMLLARAEFQVEAYKAAREYAVSYTHLTLPTILRV